MPLNKETKPNQTIFSKIKIQRLAFGKYQEHAINCNEPTEGNASLRFPTLFWGGRDALNGVYVCGFFVLWHINLRGLFNAEEQ